MTERVLAGILALFLVPFGLITLAFSFAGESTYRDLARERGVEQVTFPLEGGGSLTTDREGLTSIHAGTVAYLFGDRGELPRVGDGRPLFDAAERAHMRDVAGVFGGAEILRALAGIGLLALAIGLRRLEPAFVARIVRGGALAAAGLVLLVGAFAAVAFGPAFLLFHRIFFPQGNFLFDPATSNLLRLYPEPYWYAVTLRVAGAFLVACAALAAISTAWLRIQGSRSERSGIVPTR